MGQAIVIINGLYESGKDTFVEKCIEHYKKPAFNLSTIDKVKDLATSMGWDGVKDAKARDFLAELKQAWTKYNNGPFNDVTVQVENILNGHDDVLIFIHCREPEQIDEFIKKFPSYSTTLLVVRQERRIAGDVPTNSSDNNIDRYNYVHVIANDGTLEELTEKAGQFVDYLHYENAERR